MAEAPNWNVGGWADNQGGGGFDPNNQPATTGPAVTPLENTNIQTSPNWNSGGWAENESGGGYDPNAETNQEPPSESSSPTTTTSGTGTTVDSQQKNPNSLEVTANGVRPNPLHEFPSYTYNLSLHLLSVDDFNNLVDGKEYIAKNVLIASAGKWNDLTGANAFNRNQFFGEDFYFNSLNMTTIIGHGEANRATNAVDIKFTIVEPYGLTLLNRILAASDQLGQPWNYLANPYLLQIDFYGTDDQGVIRSPISNITKRIPIRILGLTAKITERGTEYSVTAIPFNHQAFDETASVTPVAMEITAGTVAGFFKSSPDSNAPTDVQVTQREETRVLPDGTVQPIPTLLIANYKDQVYKARSFGDALNAYMIHLEKTNQVNFANRYDFAFEEKIGNAKIFGGIDKNSPRYTPMADLSNAPILRKSTITQKNAEVLDFNQRIYPIQYGTSIDNVLALIIRNSQFVTDQLAIRDNEVDDEKYKEKLKQIKDKPLDWYKITPRIKLIAFDPSTNTFAKKITYNIASYEMRNVRLDEAPQGKVMKKYANKFYQYIYTGENTDIIDLDIEFNAAYYTAKTAYKSNEMLISGVNNYYDTGISCEIADPRLKKSIMPQQYNYRMPDQRSVATGGAKTAAEMAAADLASSIASQSVADMLHVKLKIVGDPDFIKQDDIFYGPTFDSNGWLVKETRVVTPNGSLTTDTKEVLVDLTFKTPSDIDDDTGLMKYDSRFNASGYTGLYRVLTVENMFEGGKFTQTLDLIRYPNQDDDVTVATDNRSDVFSTSTTGEGSTDTVQNAPTTTTTTPEGTNVYDRPPGYTLPSDITSPANNTALQNIRNNGQTVDISTLPSAGVDNSIANNSASSLIGGA